MLIRTILHATDFSNLSRGAFHIACSLAQDHAAKLIILHVCHPPLHHSESNTRELSNGSEDTLWQELKKMRPADPALSVEYRIVEGHAADEIVRSARKNKVDLIVLGTHGRGGLRRAVMGSVAENVLRLAPCPVLTLNSAVAMAEDAVYQSAVSVHGVCRPTVKGAASPADMGIT